MSTSYSIDPSRHLVRIILSGQADLNETIDVLNSVVNDRSYQTDLDFLFDVANITHYMTYDELSSLYEYYKATMEKKITGKVAVVITKPLQYGITRIAATIFSAKKIEVEAFYTEEKALDWLQK